MSPACLTNLPIHSTECLPVQEPPATAADMANNVYDNLAICWDEGMDPSRYTDIWSDCFMCTLAFTPHNGWKQQLHYA